jgi:hypothetical protein
VPSRRAGNIMRRLDLYTHVFMKLPTGAIDTDHEP